jgi:hypothetical protein
MGEKRHIEPIFTGGRYTDASSANRFAGNSEIISKFIVVETSVGDLA